MRRTVAVMILLALASCGRSDSNDVGAVTPNNRSGAWRKLPASPLEARRAAHAVEVGGKLLVFGGTAAPACPPGADCTTPTEAPFSDGAAYDPITEAWTSLRPSPVPIGYASSAVLAQDVYLLVAPFGSSHPTARNAFLRYDVVRDEWDELEPPPTPLYRMLTATDERVIAFQSSQENGVEGDFAFDPTSGSWSALPADPLQPSFDRSMVWTDHGLVLLGIENVPNPGAEEPALYRAARLQADGSWKRLPDSDVIGYNPIWSWTHGRVLNASTESSDGGETNNWGRVYRAGGMLDPATGEWSALPDVPGEGGGFTGIYASDERYAAAGGGWVFDALANEWLELAPPPVAPDDEHAHAWAGGELIVWGGVRWDGSDGVLLDDGWRWRPNT